MTRILIIDDDTAFTEKISSLLTRDGYEVSVAQNGLLGLNAFRVFAPDMILLDITMPEKDGWQVCREIRQQSDTPIIIISNLGETIDKILGLELGADDYMVKPIDGKELAARVKAVLRRSTPSNHSESETLRFSQHAKINAEVFINFLHFCGTIYVVYCNLRHSKNGTGDTVRTFG